LGKLHEPNENLVDRTKKASEHIRHNNITITIVSSIRTLHSTPNTMHLPTQLVILLALLVIAVEASGDQRGLLASAGYLSKSFSSEEQALFGSCNAEDCIFGSSSAYFANFSDYVVEVANGEPKKSAVPEVDEMPAGLGPPPAFIRKRSVDSKVTCALCPKVDCVPAVFLSRRKIHPTTLFAWKQ
jgi:hypothetical protein